MAEFKFNCPQCGQRVTAEEAYRGQVVQCPKCEKGIVVPRGKPILGGKRSVSGALQNSNTVLEQTSGKNGGSTILHRFLQSPKFERRIINLCIALCAVVVTCIIFYGGRLYFGNTTICGVTIKTPPGSGFKRTVDNCYCASLPCDWDDEWDYDPGDGPKIFITILDWKEGQSMKGLVYGGLCKSTEQRGLRFGTLNVDDDEALVTVTGQVLGRNESQYIKIIRDWRRNKLISITGQQLFTTLLASVKDKNPKAKRISDTIVECVNSAHLLR